MIENGIWGIVLTIVALFWIFKPKPIIPFSNQQNFPLVSIAFYSSFTVFACFSFPLQFLAFKLLLLNQIGLQNYPPLTLNFKTNKSFQIILLSSAACLLLFTIASHHKAFKAWKEASELQFSNPDSSIKLYSFTYHELENEVAFLLHYGNFIEEKDPDKALLLYEKAKQLINIPILYSKSAHLNEKLGNYKNTETNLLKVHYISPHLFKPQKELLDFYLRTTNIEKAKWIASTILKTPIKIPSQTVSDIKTKAKYTYNLY